MSPGSPLWQQRNQAWACDGGITARGGKSRYRRSFDRENNNIAAIPRAAGSVPEGHRKPNLTACRCTPRPLLPSLAGEGKDDYLDEAGLLHAAWAYVSLPPEERIHCEISQAGQ
ncbi:hypothetical protein GCM10010218_59880 [Streptomyces mashuensis]|uniref:Uncharacterized protein n=1 Tax=Streptomyces mashuensis TaxID=33904 RepID=A0A919BA49_9ACTN|nr:hypothetical protein GCM10010218_59880 [Streptomyces mashuensis]